MPIVMNPRRMHHHGNVDRTAAQKVCMGLGVAFILFGLFGTLMPGFMGMHLSMLHNFVHIASGVVAILFGFSSGKASFLYSLWGGSIYAFLGIAGFILGAPGYPEVGNMEADQNLFRFIPGFLEFGTTDHAVHLFVGIFLLLTAYTFRKERIIKKELK